MMIFMLLAQFNIVDSLHIPGGYINGCAWDGNLLWVTNNDASPGTKIHQIDTTLGAMQILLTYNYSYTSGGYTGMTYANGKLWPVYWPDDAIWEIDPADGSHDATYNAPSTAYCYGMAYDGRWFWYTDQNLNRIYRIDPATMISNGSWALPFSPKDCAFDGAYLYVMASTNTLYQLDTATLSVISSEAFPRTYCAGLAFSGNAMWVGTNGATGKVYRVEWSPNYLGGHETAARTSLSVSLWPNPARSLANLRVSEPALVKVYDAGGRLVISREGVGNLEMKSSELGGPGVYFVVVKARGLVRNLTLQVVK